MQEPAHTYNLDDFLHSSDARTEAQLEFPRVYFALFSSYVSDEFLRIDALANGKKRRLQNFGFFTVSLALLALALAAIDIALIAPIEDKTSAEKFVATALPFAAAIAGIMSFIMGYFGAGVGSRKREWLQARIQTELIRQWKARYFLNNRDKIVEASKDEQAAHSYTSTMRREFDEFRDHLRRNSGQILDEIVRGQNGVTLPEGLEKYLARLPEVDPSKPKTSDVVDEFYDAYARLRLQGQEAYASYIATADGSIRTHPRVQKEILHRSGLIAVFAIVALHVSVTLGVLTGIKELKSIYVHLATVLLALSALASRAVEDGLNPGEHLVRYAGYFSSIRYIALHYNRARTAKSKHDYAWQLEDAAFAEMVDFLASSSKARFVM